MVFLQIPPPNEQFKKSSNVRSLLSLFVRTSPHVNSFSITFSLTLVFFETIVLGNFVASVCVIFVVSKPLSHTTQWSLNEVSAPPSSLHLPVQRYV